MDDQMKSEAELITLAKAGDGTAIGTLYDRYVKRVYRFVYRRVDRHEDAEDLTSEVMISMVRHLQTYAERASFQTWLFTIARNKVASFWRSRYRQPELLVAAVGDMVAEVPEEIASKPPEEYDDQRLEAAREVFMRLPENYRRVLELRFFEQCTVAETASSMSTSIENVKVLQHRALKKAAQLAKEVV